MILVFDHTPHTKKQTTKPAIASHATNIVRGTNCRSIGPQNGPIPQEHAIQGPHTALGMVLPILTHMSTPIIRNYLPIITNSPYGQPNPIPWVSIPLKPHMPTYVP
jgi:hypothetical protein